MTKKETDFAQFLEDWIIEFFAVGQDQAQLLKMIFLIIITAVVAYVIWKVAHLILDKIISRIVTNRSAQLSNLLLEKTFVKLSYIILAIYITAALPVIFSDYPAWIPAIEMLTLAYIAIVVMQIILSAISATNTYLSTASKFKDKPIDSFTQLAKIIVWILGSIYIISIIINQNPLALFGTLGAVSAVFLLIFKDTILGFIASIQLTINDMIRIGDWVSVPNYGADGDVIAILLTTIKVRNWDRTISTIPTYSFVSESFKNWRGMEESGGRRIMRSINFKISSVRFCDEEMLERYAKIELIKDHIQKRREEILAHNTKNNVDTDSSIVNGRRMTNIGIFRVYILNTLINNPNINLDMTHMVRQLEPTKTGIPLEVYCFSRIKSWIKYEGIQADIFDHIMATARHFDLVIFEIPASSDLQQLTFKKPTE